MWLIIKHPRCLLLCALLVLAEIPSAESIVITEQARVQNDTMEVLFVAKALSGSPESAVLDVVTLTDWALSYQASYPEVMMLQATPQKAQYYDTGKRLVQWSASQELKIKSENLEKMRALANQLLDRLEPVRAQFLLSERKRAKIEQQLLNKVLERYDDERSHLVAKSPNYIRITADNFAGQTSKALSETFLKAGSLNVDFQPGFSVIKVELVGI